VPVMDRGQQQALSDLGADGIQQRHERGAARAPGRLGRSLVCHSRLIEQFHQLGSARSVRGTTIHVKTRMEPPKLSNLVQTRRISSNLVRSHLTGAGEDEFRRDYPWSSMAG